jgi:hypothetical protein
MPYTGRAVGALPSSVQLLNQMNTKVLEIQIYIPLEYAHNKLKARYDLVVNLDVPCPF